MSLSRTQVHGLRSAGWTVVEEGPLIELRRRLFGGRRRRLGRLQPVGPVVHVPVRRWSR